MKSDSPPCAPLLGTWKLVSVEDTLSGHDQPVLPYGAHPVGFLMYQPDGHMCATLTDGERKPWKDAAHPTDAEKIAYYDSFVAYAGTFQVDLEQSVVTHYPTVAWWPGFVGTIQTRPFRLEGDRLIITVSENIGDPRIKKRVLVWQRAKTSSQ